MGFFLTFLIFAAVFLLAEIFRPKPNIENAKPAGLGDFDFPTATEGRSIPIVWGTVKIAGPNVIWFGDFRQQSIKEKVKTGLFSSRRVTTGFRYFIGIQFAVCRGPVDFYRRVWVGEKVVAGGPIFPGSGQINVDEPSLFGGDKLGQGGIVGDLEWFRGTANQTASAYLQPFQSVSGQQNAYRYLCYAAPVTDPPYVGNSTNIKAWAFEVERIPQGTSPNPTVPGGSFAQLDPINSDISAIPGQGIDANPVFVLYEIMTDLIWGLGIPAAEIDNSSFDDAATIVRAEKNGFSFILDSPQEVSDVIRIIEEHIDGVVFQDPVDGLWKINLTRPDATYTDNSIAIPPALPEINASNMIELRSFARGSWDDTTNAVDVEYADRTQNYGTKFGKAQDQANVQLQGGVIVKTNVRFPGCKTNVSANDLAWRELRTLAFPLAKLEVIVDRTFWNAQPAQVVTFTDVDLGLTAVRFRVVDADFSDLVDGRIRLNLIEDVFRFDDGSFGNPPASGWVPPSSALVPFAAGTEVVFEAPRKFVALDPESTTEDGKVWCGARDAGVEVAFNILARSGPSSPPTGSFVEAGDAFDFILIAELDAALPAGSAYPLAQLDLDCAAGAPVDTAAAVAAAFTLGATLSDIGLNLINLIMIGDVEADREFLLVEGASDIGGDIVRLTNVYRGVMDTPQRDHPTGARVYLLFNGGSLTDDLYNQADFVQTKLQPISIDDEVDEGLITAFELQMLERIRRPYPPSQVDLNGTPWDDGDPTPVSLDANGSGFDDDGILVEILRRSFVIDDEISQLGTDASALTPSFPAAFNTEHRMDVINDPDGTPTTILSALDFGSGQAFTVLRNAILAQTAGVIPSRLRIEIQARHDFEMATLTARNLLRFDFDVASPQLAPLFNFGALPINTASAVYTAPSDGAYPLALDTALPGSGVVEFRINGGTWTVGIAAGMTSGSVPGVLTNDTIEVRHVSTVGTTEQMLRLSTPAAVFAAYAILTN